MLMPTEEQRVRIMVHHAWDLRDEGLQDAEVVQRLVAEGVPTPLAQAVPALIDSEAAKLIHDAEARQSIIEEVEFAVEAEDFHAMREAILAGVDDERTLHKIYDRLSELLLAESHEQGTVAAFGLSCLIGRGDWPLIQALSHEDDNVRLRAAFALGQMGKAAHKAMEPLQKALSDQDEYVRAAAEESLAAIRRALKPWWKFW